MRCKEITISELQDLYKNNRLELNPPYQRRPVWKFKQRQLLLTSIFNGIPLPAIILNKRPDAKRQFVLDVLDGKQRIETILEFIGRLPTQNDRELFVKKRTSSNEDIVIKFKELKRLSKNYDNIESKFWNYKIPVIEFDGEVTDFFGNPVPTMEIFVRINSTGSPLKKNEVRHASNAGPFFKLGDDLENKYKEKFISTWKVFTPFDVERYVLHEFLMELCTAIFFENFTDKRKKLDELIRNKAWDEQQLQGIRKRFDEIIKWIGAIFPAPLLPATRFRNKSEFYSLFVVLNHLIEKDIVNSNPKSNKILGNFLIDFSIRAQEVASKLKKYSYDKSLAQVNEELNKYVISTREGTDAKANREIRHNYLLKIMQDFLKERKDNRRLFDANVRGILWSGLLIKSKTPKCPNPNDNPNCLMTLTFDNAQVDHIYPWIRGGKTTKENARLICASCNRSKGARI